MWSMKTDISKVILTQYYPKLCQFSDDVRWCYLVTVLVQKCLHNHTHAYHKDIMISGATEHLTSNICILD